MTWTGQSFSVGQILTAAQMTNLQADITALANGDSGAPAIQTAAYGTGTVDQAAIGANTVGQSEVKTAGQQINASSSQFTATGGIYILGFTARELSGTDNLFEMRRQGNANDGTEVAEWLWSSGVGSNDVGTLYYINSSPPYDLGDGEIPLFIDAVVDVNGDIVKMSIAPDPVWAYNGPTNCVPALYDRETGKTYRARKDMGGFNRTWRASVGLGRAGMEEYIEAFANAPTILEELTQDIKNADKDIVPHAFAAVGAVDPGHTAVLIDPVDPVLWRLLEMRQHEEGADEIVDILRDYMRVGNTPLNRAGPQGIRVVPISWR